MPVCTKCNTEKPEEDFYRASAAVRGDKVLRAACKSCTLGNNLERQERLDYREARRQRYHSDPEFRAAWAKQARVYRLRSQYGISTEQYAEMLAAQNGVCAICGLPEKLKQALAVDHDPLCCPGRKSCGKCIRGLLCFNCNTSVGKLEPHLDRVVEYLS